MSLQYCGVFNTPMFQNKVNGATKASPLDMYKNMLPNRTNTATFNSGRCERFFH